MNLKDMRFLILILSILFLNSLVAQPGKGRANPSQFIEIGETLLAQKSYYNAAEYFEKALKFGGPNIGIQYRLAEVYVKARNYKEAVRSYKKVMDFNDPGTALNYPTLSFDYAMMLKQIGEYQSAKAWFSSFIREYKGDRQDYFLTRANVELEGCELAIEEKNNFQIKVEPLSEVINYKYTNYAPRPIGEDYMIFSSIRSKNKIKSNQRYAKSSIYVTQKQDIGWSEPTVYKGPFLSDGEHVGHGAFSPNNNRFYFTRCSEDLNGKLLCNIYVSELIEERWSNPMSISEINIAGYQSTSPFVVQDKRGAEKIYFSSNRLGGQGGFDIWTVSRDAEGNFSAALNLEKINTVNDERTPFYNTKENVLFFSSNGYAGFGGLDIFKSYLTDGQWGLVKNIGKPFNSSADDMYFIQNAKVGEGFLVSNRPSSNGIDSPTCCDQIYEYFPYEGKEEPIVDPLTNEPVLLKGNIYGPEGNQNGSLGGVWIQLFELKSNGDLLWLDEASSKSGIGYEFEVNYGRTYEIKVSKPGYSTRSHQVKINERETFIKNIDLEGQGVQLIGSIKTASPQGMKSLSNAFLKLYTLDPSTGQEKFERTINVDPSGKFSLFLPSGKNYLIEAEANGFLKQNLRVSPIEGRLTNQKKDFVLEKVNVGKITMIDDVYYLNDGYTLDREGYSRFNSIVNKLKKNPGFKIELGVHTDSSGSDEANIELSTKQGNSIKSYFLSQGVKDQQVRVKAYGESQPIVPNTSPDNRRKNRRVEIKTL